MIRIDFQEKLWGAAESLRHTADLIIATKMDIQYGSNKEEEEGREF